MNVVFFGATKGIGRAIARRLSARGDRLFLLGRSKPDLETSAHDLSIRAPNAPSVSYAPCDLAEPDTFGPAFEAAAAALGRVDAVVVTAADFATQAALEADLDRARRLLDVDFTNTIIFCEKARTTLLATGGTLCVLSSVAGDRARKPVIIYGAAKAGLSHYLEGLDHKYRSAGLRVVCVKPGFIKTGMTAGLPAPPFAAEADDIAAGIVNAIDKGRPIVYAPAIWWPIMLVIRLLPRAVMRRVGF